MPRNPFNVMDVPDPDDNDVKAFAAGASLHASADDANASAWAIAGSAEAASVEGHWSSRWNGGADPTIPGDNHDQWKQGEADVKLAGERIFLLFDWNGGARKGLIDARRDGARLVGKYINLTDPAITQPWIGTIISNERIDGRWPQGRLDFRR